MCTGQPTVCLTLIGGTDQGNTASRRGNFKATNAGRAWRACSSCLSGAAGGRRATAFGEDGAAPQARYDEAARALRASAGAWHHRGGGSGSVRLRLLLSLPFGLPAGGRGGPCAEPEAATAAVGLSRKQLRESETAASTGEERGGQVVAEMAFDWLGVALLGKDAEPL